MKAVVVCLLLAVCQAAMADEAVSDRTFRHKFTLTTNFTGGVLVWTNHVENPMTLRSVSAQSESGAATLAIRWERPYDYWYQTIGDVVETNEFDEVVTNRYTQVTNTTYAVYTNYVLSAAYTSETVSASINNLVGARRLSEDDYTLPGDVWTVTYGTTATVSSIVLNFTE